jgi:hypothetical protein
MVLPLEILEPNMKNRSKIDLYWQSKPESTQILMLALCKLYNMKLGDFLERLIS